MDSMSGPWLGQGVRFFVLFGFGGFFLVRFRLLAGVACRWHAQWWINFYLLVLSFFYVMSLKCQCEQLLFKS